METPQQKNNISNYILISAIMIVFVVGIWLFTQSGESSEQQPSFFSAQTEASTNANQLEKPPNTPTPAVTNTPTPSPTPTPRPKAPEIPTISPNSPSEELNNVINNFNFIGEKAANVNLLNSSLQKPSVTFPTIALEQ